MKLKLGQDKRTGEDVIIEVKDPLDHEEVHAALFKAGMTAEEKVSPSLRMLEATDGVVGSLSLYVLADVDDPEAWDNDEDRGHFPVLFLWPVSE